jgi:hypothetical protein
MAVFWDVPPVVGQILTDVSEDLTASIIRPMSDDGGNNTL